MVVCCFCQSLIFSHKSRVESIDVCWTGSSCRRCQRSGSNWQWTGGELDLSDWFRFRSFTAILQKLEIFTRCRSLYQLATCASSSSSSSSSLSSSSSSSPALPSSSSSRRAGVEAYINSELVRRTNPHQTGLFHHLLVHHFFIIILFIIMYMTIIIYMIIIIYMMIISIHMMIIIKSPWNRSLPKW